jgi:hypothetical protein
MGIKKLYLRSYYMINDNNTNAEVEKTTINKTELDELDLLQEQWETYYHKIVNGDITWFCYKKRDNGKMKWFSSFKKDDLDNEGKIYFDKMWKIAGKMYELRKKAGTINKEKRRLKEELKILNDKEKSVNKRFCDIGREYTEIEKIKKEQEKLAPENQKIKREICKYNFLLDTYKK